MVEQAEGELKAEAGMGGVEQGMTCGEQPKDDCGEQPKDESERGEKKREEKAEAGLRAVGGVIATLHPPCFAGMHIGKGNLVQLDLPIGASPALDFRNPMLLREVREHRPDSSDVPSSTPPINCPTDILRVALLGDLLGDRRHPGEPIGLRSFPGERSLELDTARGRLTTQHGTACGRLT